MGFGLIVLGSIIHVLCLPFVDLVVLSTNSSIAILINNFLSVAYLDEKLVWAYDATAVTLIMAGSLAICVLSDYSETTYTADDIRALIWSPQTMTFIVIILVFIVCCVL